MEGQLVHKFVAAEPCFGLGDVVVTTAVAAVEVSIFDVVVLVGIVEGDDETMGAGTTSFDEELWAFRYERPPPIT